MHIFFSQEKKVRVFIVLFMIGLTLSGLTAIPAQWETEILRNLFGTGTWLGNSLPEIARWVDLIYAGVQNSYGQYPFLAYPNDWLAFGHIVIAVAFIGPLRDPIKNIWVIEFGMIACLLVIPWALIFGFPRGIPWLWTLVDMSFGIFGIIPLWYVRWEILQMSSNKP